MKIRAAFALAVAGLLVCSAAPAPKNGTAYTLLIRGGTIYDGSGGKPYVGDVALKGDRIAYVGPHAPGRAARVVDAKGKAVSPGFVNMMSWATESLIADGRGVSDTMQGVTLEVMGEGDSMGPLTPRMKQLAVKRQGDINIPSGGRRSASISNIFSARESRRTSHRSSGPRRSAFTNLARRTSTRPPRS